MSVRDAQAEVTVGYQCTQTLYQQTHGMHKTHKDDNDLRLYKCRVSDALLGGVGEGRVRTSLRRELASSLDEVPEGRGEALKRAIRLCGALGYIRQMRDIARHRA